MSDYVGLPASRRSAPGTARPIASRSTATATTSTTGPTTSATPISPSAWTVEGDQGEWAVPTTWQQVQEVTKFLKGKQVDGQDAYGYLDVCKPGAGSAGTSSPAARPPTPSTPDDKAWLFDADTMKPRINNPAFVRAIQDVDRHAAVRTGRPDQRRREHHRVQRVPRGTGSMCAWWGDVGSNVYTSDSSVVQDKVGFSILPVRTTSTTRRPAHGKRFQSGPELRAEYGLSRLGRLCHGTRSTGSGQAEGRLEYRGSPWRHRSRSGLTATRQASSRTATATSTLTTGWQPGTRGLRGRYLKSELILQPSRTPRSSRASRVSSSTTAPLKTSWRRPTRQ